MLNSHLGSRIDGIVNVLNAAFESGKLLSSASKGNEREIFISLFLNAVLPPIYRFGSGDIIDSIDNSDNSRRSGQIDIVIEMPWAPSFPDFFGAGSRLYPAEAVGAAIEIKSNLMNQWHQVSRTADTLSALRQKLSGVTVEEGSLSILDETIEPVPLYAVGYEGWATAETVEEKLQTAHLDGILILKHKVFAWSDRRAFLLRLRKCEEELKEVRKGKPKTTFAACARSMEILKSINDSSQIVTILNNEGWSLTPVNLGDNKLLPQINSGAWTSDNLKEFQKAFMQKTFVLTGLEAVIQFISSIHKEVGKRSAMSFELVDYKS